MISNSKDPFSAFDNKWRRDGPSCNLFTYCYALMVTIETMMALTHASSSQASSHAATCLHVAEHEFDNMRMKGVEIHAFVMKKYIRNDAKAG